MIELQLNVFDGGSTKKYLYLRKMDKVNAIEINRKIREQFYSFFIPAEQEILPIIQVQLWKIEGNRNQYRSFLEESYLGFSVKEKLVSFIEQELGDFNGKRS
ncbi:hypothetical protein SAMN05421743_105240 [Thalassobacillus cyri]|uniref:Uncharacterized protein n=1 Tax=Thalassobacillus cyri TaxID=571932 RepID=A0A1H4C2G6_9BACI|nr:hypothetical protein [Thalassobacillus cyri]SEA54611.1 hypothetical protein SAMN05421743_105240 [Thalassobacillus cyri]